MHTGMPKTFIGGCGLDNTKGETGLALGFY
jgi:hypothetical protein